MNNQRTGKVLGDLEKEVMEIIWKADKPLAVKDVLSVLQRKRTIAYTTVMTIMSRLADKGVLNRRLEGSNYLYQPKLSQERFVANAAHRIFATAISTLGEGVVTYFIKEIQKLSPKKRKALLEILSDE